MELEQAEGPSTVYATGKAVGKAVGTSDSKNQEKIGDKFGNVAMNLLRWRLFTKKEKSSIVLP